MSKSIENKRFALDLSALSADVRRHIRWNEVRSIGVVHINKSRSYYVLDSFRGFALILRMRKNRVQKVRLSIKDFDAIMARFGRVFLGRRLMDAEAP